MGEEKSKYFLVKWIDRQGDEHKEWFKDLADADSLITFLRSTNVYVIRVPLSE